MALVHWDGFNLGDYALQYTATGCSASSTTPFSLGMSLSCSGNFTKSLPAADDEWYVGFRFYVSSNMDTSQRAIAGFFADSGAVQHISVGFRSNGCEVRRGNESGTLIDSWTGGSLAATSWYAVEIYVKVADSGGRVTVKVDGTTRVDFTGDTKNGGTSSNLDLLRFAGNGVAVLYDDLYVCDATGSSPYNTFLGDVRVAPLIPSGAGNSTGMTPSTGANYTTQDERAYSATDYVTGSSGQKDTYALGDLPSGVATILAVKAVVIAKKTDAGALSARTVVRSGSTDYVGSSVSLGTTDALLSTDYLTDPNTSSAWTTSNVNALQAGAEVV